MSAHVTIYSTPSCHFCHMAKAFFDEKNVAYTEFDVAADMNKRQEMITLTGQLGVPVIVIDGEPIVGFNQEMIAQKLGV